MANSNLIGSDAPLSDKQRACARAITDLIIPRSADGRMPSAAQFDVIGYVTREAPDRLPAIRGDIDTLERVAQATFDASFDVLNRVEQAQLTDGQRSRNGDFLRELVISTTHFYYQQDAVLEALGLESRPPHPRGHTVKSGDLSLLDPVRERGRMYREVDHINEDT